MNHYAYSTVLILPPVSFFSGNKTAGKVNGSSKPCRSATTRCIAMQNSSRLRALSLLMSDRCLTEKGQVYFYVQLLTNQQTIYNCPTHHILDKTSTGKLDFMKKSLALGP